MDRPNTMCLACDETYYDGRKMCMRCTVINFRLAGHPISLTQLMTMSGPVLQHPELIVKTVPYRSKT